MKNRLWIIGIVFLLLVASLMSCGHGGGTAHIEVVATLAGSAGALGDADGIGTLARFYTPFGITTNGTSLYVADTGNSTIRKIDIATGTVSTLAGSPTVTGSADGTGTAASFYTPFGVTMFGTSLYVADTGNHTIRKIDISSGVGVVTPLAGSAGVSGSTDGTGTAARFSLPHSVTTDGTSLYVADTGNSTIRKVDIASELVSTLTGTAGITGFDDGPLATARFYHPAGIALSGTSLYVADTGNSIIRKIDIVTGTVSTLAGSPTGTGSTDGTGTAARFNQPADITTDGTSLYVTDTGNSTIRKIDIASGVVTTLAGSAGESGSADGPVTTARFYRPAGITLYTNRLFIADTLDSVIRTIQ